MATKPTTGDNLYPNSGEFFTPKIPIAQEEAHQQEEAEVFNDLPLIQKVVKHFESRIKARDSIKAISVNIVEDPLLHQKTCAVNEMVAEALSEEKKLLEALIREYIPTAED